jgi:hypothetical protein
MDTDAFIARIADDAEPVRRLPPPWLRTAFWLALGLPPLALVVAGHGLDVGLDTILGDQRLIVEQIAVLATAISAAVAAFASTVPGANRRWLWVPVVPLAAWLLTVGKGCLDDFVTLGSGWLDLSLDTGCLLPMILISIVPAIAMVVMLKRGAPLSPRLTLALGALATAAIVNFGLRLFHVGDISLMILVWHFGLIAVVSALAGIVGPRVLAWRQNVISRPATA